MEKEQDLFQEDPELARRIASLIVPARAGTLVREKNTNIIRVVYDE